MRWRGQTSRDPFWRGYNAIGYNAISTWQSQMKMDTAASVVQAKPSAGRLSVAGRAFGPPAGISCGSQGSQAACGTGGRWVSAAEPDKRG